MEIAWCSDVPLIISRYGSKRLALLGVRALYAANNPGLFFDSKLLPVGSSNARVRTIANRYLDLLVEPGGELRILCRRVICVMWEWVTVVESDRVAPFVDS